MSDTQKFLESMYNSILNEEKKKIDENVKKSVANKLKLMVGNQIISSEEAMKFANDKELELDLKSKTKNKTVETDPCGTTVRSSC